MYRTHKQWENALRVARTYGGPTNWKQVAFAWAVELGGSEGSKLLMKLGLIEQAIEYLCEMQLWEQAMQTATQSLRSKLPFVYYKHAMVLEDTGDFAAAELEFVRAGRPKEAIDMYVHQRDWAAAMRVAESHDPSEVAAVFFAQAKVAAAGGDMTRAEQLYIRAGNPEAAVRMYIDARIWKEALRVAGEYIPQMIGEIHAEHDKSLGTVEGADSADPVAQAKLHERRGEYPFHLYITIDIFVTIYLLFLV